MFKTPNSSEALSFTDYIRCSDEVFEYIKHEISPDDLCSISLLRKFIGVCCSYESTNNDVLSRMCSKMHIKDERALHIISSVFTKIKKSQLTEKEMKLFDLEEKMESLSSQIKQLEMKMGCNRKKSFLFCFANTYLKKIGALHEINFSHGFYCQKSKLMEKKAMEKNEWQYINDEWRKLDALLFEGQFLYQQHQKTGQELEILSCINKQHIVWSKFLDTAVDFLCAENNILLTDLAALEVLKNSLEIEHSNLKKDIVDSLSISNSEELFIEHMYIGSASLKIPNQYDHNYHPNKGMKCINGIHYLQVGPTIYNRDNRLCAPFFTEEKKNVYSTQASPNHDGVDLSGYSQDQILNMSQLGRDLFTQIDKGVFGDELIVIHSSEGKSRSAVFIALYLIYCLQNDHERIAPKAVDVVDKIIGFIRSKQKDIWIGNSWRKQLIEYAEALYYHPNEPIPITLLQAKEIC